MHRWEVWAVNIVTLHSVSQPLPRQNCCCFSPQWNHQDTQSRQTLSHLTLSSTVSQWPLLSTVKSREHAEPTFCPVPYHLILHCISQPLDKIVAASFHSQIPGTCRANTLCPISPNILDSISQSLDGIVAASLHSQIPGTHRANTPCPISHYLFSILFLLMLYLSISFSSNISLWMSWLLAVL